MVKVDVRRDYYADLNLTAGADAEDIKKQFRKLALKYHPDRNPGKEVESNAKFQAIQAAHEILIDPHQRLKYDTERLRSGFYGPKTSSARRESAAYPTPKPNTKAQFSERPKSFHNGPSTGAQRYASYARAAPKQPWEQMRDQTQTRADAYRGFQEMKGGPGGWSTFDPRGRAGQAGAVPRPAGPTNGSTARPKSAYEHLHTGTKPTTAESAHAQFGKKKQGFAPRAAGGDEPMAANTASYRNASRFDRFTPAPSPTSRKPAAGFPSGAENVNPAEYERSSSKYATTGGEKTFFSSSMLGRSGSARTPPKNHPNPRPRTNPPSPDPQHNGRHRSASPSLRADGTRNYDSTSSSESSEDEVTFKPKAVPKSRLRQQQKYSNFHGTNGWNTGTTHDSDSAGSMRNNSDTPVFSKKADFAFASKDFAQNGTFKSSSHDDLRKSSRREPFAYSPESSKINDRGRASTRDTPSKGTGNTPKRESSRSKSASQQMPFSQESFINNNWAEAFQFRDLSDALPNSEGSQRQPNPQRTRSPRKQTRQGTRLRPTPQQASVATEAEEAESTVGGDNGQVPSNDAEAMDLDDEVPAKDFAPATASGATASRKTAPLPKAQPGPKSGSKDAANNPLNMKILSGVFPFTSTNSGGLEDLKDIASTLPFESRTKAPKTAMGNTHPRQLACPNPPKRPEPPQPVQISAGSKQPAIARVALDRYIAEMAAYVREWETFNGRMVTHFLARHRSNVTEMAPNWIGAIGDSLRLSDDEAGDDSDDNTGPPTRRGFTSYTNALVQDEKVMKHWEVARERHLECMLKHGQLREWLRSGGRII
ncbi:hypothetical protein BJY04DRAFT_83340 [Aspergillus karnatakaensis]|uniref:DnaJ domain protein n=1 Tax=Aspergillus karnatakaensis TaxID=1810916 RepID=UPI003CCE45A2